MLNVTEPATILQSEPRTQDAKFEAVPTPARRKWLLLFNCQSLGLGSLLNLLCRHIEVSHHDPASIDQHKEFLLANLHHFDRIVIAPWVEQHLGVDLGNDPRVMHVPTFTFGGYHPDLGSFATPGVVPRGPLLGNFSLLSYAAFRCGLDERQALALYREDIYASMGYFDHWDQERVNFLARFSAYGFDMRQPFIDWSRRGPFVHSPAHPKMHCLRDIAKAILARAGEEVTETDILPYDNMAAGINFAIYPEIATRLGVRGDYLFKAAGKFELMTLEEFIGESFHYFRQNEELAPRESYEAMAERAVGVVKAVA